VDVRQVDGGYYKFREWTNGYVDEVICISEYGKKLFAGACPDFKGQVSVSKLAVEEKAMAPVPKGKIFRIVSCSSAIPIKRLDKIAGLLANSSHNILWVHFGDGPELEKLRKYIYNFPKNIGFEAKGKISNASLMQYYRETEIDVFINASLLEGIPYSMIEAAAHGIPLAGFNVCGIPEILEKDMGILLDPDADTKENAAKLKSFLLSGFCTDMDYRENVRKKTRENFSAEKNYGELLDKLKAWAA
jgi:glycosyltransferase involved in cell wall biosynthesis